MDFAKRLQVLLENCGKTQYMLAKDMGCTQSLISAYMRGDKKPTLDRFPMLCASLGVTPAIFFSDDDAPALECELLASFRILPEDKQRQAIRIVKSL